MLLQLWGVTQGSAGDRAAPEAGHSPGELIPACGCDQGSRLGTALPGVFGVPDPAGALQRGQTPPGLALGTFPGCAGQTRQRQGSCEQPFLGILSGNSVWILHSSVPPGHSSPCWVGPAEDLLQHSWGTIPRSLCHIPSPAMRDPGSVSLALVL